MTGTQPDVAVVGAGVIGLTTAVCLAERGRSVLVVSRDQPLATVSAVASAMIGPWFGPDGDPLIARARAEAGEFTALAGMAGTGVYLRRGRLVSRAEDPLPPGREPCAPEDLPDGFGSGFWARLPLVDMPVYLDYLTRRLAAVGAGSRRPRWARWPKRPRWRHWWPTAPGSAPGIWSRTPR